MLRCKKRPYSQLSRNKNYQPRLLRLETRDVPSVAVVGAGQGGGPLVAVFNTQASNSTPVRQFFAYDPSFRGGVRVAAADISGDHVPDIVTAPGPGGGPHVKVFDGATGKVIRSFFAYDPSFTGGVSIAVGDVNADGVPDIITGAGVGGGPSVRVFDGKSGNHIREFYAFDPGFTGGVRIAAGDIDGDGSADIIVGAGAGGGPHVRAFSGNSGKLMTQFFAFPGEFTGGVNVAAGDLNGDGRSEIITVPGLGGGPLVRVWSGATAKMQSQFNAYPTTIVNNQGVGSPWTSGLNVSATSHGAGRDDIIVGPGPMASATVRIFDGQTNTKTREYSIFAAGFAGGIFVGGNVGTVPAPNPPQATLSANPTTEGATGQVSFSNASGGSGSYLYSFDFDNNGAFEIDDSSSANATVPASYLSDGPGLRTVRGRIKDSQGAFTDYTAALSVQNVAPTAKLNASYAGASGAPITFAVAVTDPSPTDMAAGFTYAWDFGDGGQSTQKSPAYSYAKAGSYTVSVTVSDKDGGIGTTTAMVTITAAAPPQATLTGGSANEGNTGAVSFSNPTGGSGGYLYSFDFDNNGTFEVTDSTSGTTSVPATYLADGPGSRVVRGRIKDSAGAFTDYTTTISINNVAPTVTLNVPSSGSAGTALNFAATVSDTSPVDTSAGFTYLWDFGDGSTSTQKAPSHTYASAGSYTVSLKASDKDNGATTKTTTAIITSTTTSFPNNVTVPPLPPPSGTLINVSTLSQLQNAVSSLKSGQTIVVQPGTYNLTGPLYFPQNISNVGIRGATNNRDDVVIRGNGMAGTVTFGIWVGNLQGITIANLTLKDFSQDGIILNAGAQAPFIHNVHLLDIGDQMIKSNPDGSGGGVNDGVLQYSVMEYSSGWAPDYYVAGLDTHTSYNWLVQYNVFKGFRQQGGGANATHPALLMWNDNRNTRALFNTFINNDRDISLGLYNTAQSNSALFDQQGGRIEGNMISRDAATVGDVAIFVTGPNTKIYHNTYYDASGKYPNGIEYRFANTTNIDIKNNLMNRGIQARDGATGSVSNNLTNAQSTWFVNVAVGDLHLTASATPALNTGVALTGSVVDYDGQNRVNGTASDIGADEF